MRTLVFIPFLLQTMVICIDEYYFHIKRGLPKWERIGHPIDTLSVLLCFAVAIFAPFSMLSLKIYIGLAIFSCILVTKDEFVHKHHCPASEQWLHAFLFMNHPILLTAVGLIWARIQLKNGPQWLFSWLDCPNGLKLFLIVQGCFTIIFFFYQVIYWNFLWKEQNQV